MPLTGTGPVLGQAMLDAIDAAVASNPEAGSDQRKAIWKGVGEAIIAHITTNGIGAITGVVAATPGPVPPGVPAVLNIT